MSILKLFFKLTTLGLSKGSHITRYSMYEHLSKHRKEWPDGSKALSISGSQRLCKILGLKDDQIQNVQYPEVNMLRLPFPDGAFDVVVSDQVLEHVEGSPFDAIKEAFRVIKPNGIALHTTCFLNKVHGAPGDFWRFTPEALQLMTKEYGQIIECRGWGSPSVFFYIVLGMKRLPIPHAVWHPLHWFALNNNEKWPIVTWVLCRKNDVDVK